MRFYTSQLSSIFVVRYPRVQMPPARVDDFLWLALFRYRNKLKYYDQIIRIISAKSAIIKKYMSPKNLAYILRNEPDFVLENSRFPFQ